MTYTRTKICGITRPDDARAVADAGADAIGLVFYPPSPRAVTLSQAQQIVAALPPLVTVVALFVDESASEVGRLVAELPIDLLQFHGQESPGYCRQFGRPWMKALRVREGADITGASAAYAGARAVLLDTWQPGVPGGTGKTFDWQLARAEIPLPLVLAGGLNPHNVGAAVAQVGPAAVDVSGGVESSPGIKDAGLIQDFVAAVRRADTARGGVPTGTLP